MQCLYFWRTLVFRTFEKFIFLLISSQPEIAYLPIQTNSDLVPGLGFPLFTSYTSFAPGDHTIILQNALAFSNMVILRLLYICLRIGKKFEKSFLNSSFKSHFNLTVVF